MPGGTWAVQGGMTIDKKVAFKGSCSLLLARSLQSINRPWSVTSPAFAIAPGIWEVSLATKSDLQSPDSSYSGVVSLECSGAKGQVIERFTIADVFGKRDWAPIARRIELPPGAHFRAASMSNSTKPMAASGSTSSRRRMPRRRRRALAPSPGCSSRRSGSATCSIPATQFVWT